MDKSNLVPGRKYLYHRKIVIDERELEAERWIQCLEITGSGAAFRHEYEVFELMDHEIKEELKE